VKNERQYHVTIDGQTRQTRPNRHPATRHHDDGYGRDDSGTFQILMRQQGAQQTRGHAQNPKIHWLPYQISIQ
jgi:hypothetical protein